jgi:glycosyltransferase involved in cell wall biosynthesis
MVNKMNIVFLATDRVEAGAFNRDTALIRAFESLGVKVTGIAPIHPPGPWFERLRPGLLHRLGYNVFSSCDGARLRRLAVSIENQLRGIQADIIFSRSTHFTAWLNTPLPVVNWVDAVFDCIVDFYPSFTHLDYLSLRAGHRAEKHALNRSDSTLLWSFWAAERAVRCYHSKGSRLGVVQAPAILPNEPDKTEVLSMRSGARKVLKCLVVGNDWQRKGADIALEAVRKVRGLGLDVRLVTLGMKVPSELPTEPWLEILAPLQKSHPAEYVKFCQVFLNADVFLLPSRADFSPNVIGESYAFGVPVIGSPVGGISEMIEHGQTGFVVQQVEDVDEYARFLHRLANEPGLISYQAVASRSKYEAEFALPVVARKLVAHLESVIYRSKIK